MRREDIRAGIRRRTAHLNEFVTLPLFAHPKFPSFPPNSLSEGAREERERERERRGGAAPKMKERPPPRPFMFV